MVLKLSIDPLLELESLILQVFLFLREYSSHPILGVLQISCVKFY